MNGSSNMQLISRVNITETGKTTILSRTKLFKRNKNLWLTTEE